MLADDMLGAEDDGWGDVWRFSIPPNRHVPPARTRAKKGNYGLEKWLLCDAFLRRAVRDRTFDFYALADDDTLYNATTLVRPRSRTPV